MDQQVRPDASSLSTHASRLKEAVLNPLSLRSYTTRSPKSASPTLTSSSNPSQPSSVGAIGEVSVPKRPSSPTKLSQTFIHDDGELHSVFGSVLSPQDHWRCAACTASFKQVRLVSLSFVLVALLLTLRSSCRRRPSTHTR